MRAFVLTLLFSSACVQASDIQVAGVLSGKALLIVDGAPPKLYLIGSTVGDGAKLVGVGGDSITIEEGGKRVLVALGAAGGGGSGAGDAARAVLMADTRGHFFADGKINGVGARMMVDTGATTIAMPAADAQRFGIDYHQGRVITTSTANGPAKGYLVRLDSIRVGGLEMSQLDAVVHETGLSTILLGNNFLNRCDMRRDSAQMTLTKRY